LICKSFFAGERRESTNDMVAKMYLENYPSLFSLDFKASCPGEEERESKND